MIGLLWKNVRNKTNTADTTEEGMKEGMNC